MPDLLHLPCHKSRTSLVLALLPPTKSCANAARKQDFMRIGSQYFHMQRFICVVGSLVLFAQLAAATQPPAPILVSASGPQWGSTPFGAPQTGAFSAEIDAVPQATSTDGGIG